MQLKGEVIGLLIARQSESFQRSIRSAVDEGPSHSPRELALLDSSLGEGLRKVLRDEVLVDRAHMDIDRWAKQGIETSCGLSLQSSLPLSAPPFVIFSKGRSISHLRDASCVSIVGTRKCDQLGSDIASLLGKLAALNGNTVVSGLAAGIDGASHSGALDSGGEFPTVAVLGNGVNVCYPAIHRRLYSRILDSGGMLLSEYEPDERPLPYRFLERNRIIASLSYGTVVIQASGKSGSLATARFALEMGRDVLVVPGPFGDPRYEGSHRLIQHGAYLLSSPTEIFDLIPALRKREDSAVSLCSEVVLTETQQKVALALKEKGTLHIEELRSILGNPPSFAEDLLNLELEDIVHHEPGDYLSIRSFAIPHSN